MDELAVSPNIKHHTDSKYNSRALSPLIPRYENRQDMDSILIRSPEARSRSFKATAPDLNKSKQKIKDPFLRRIHEYREIYEEFMNKRNDSIFEKQKQLQYSQNFDVKNDKSHNEKLQISNISGLTSKDISPNQSKKILAWPDMNSSNLGLKLQLQVTEQDEDSTLSREDLNTSPKQSDRKLKLKELIQGKQARRPSSLLRGRNMIPSLTPTLVAQKKILDSSFQIDKTNKLNVSSPVVKIRKNSK